MFSESGQNYSDGRRVDFATTIQKAAERDKKHLTCRHFKGSI